MTPLHRSRQCHHLRPVLWHVLLYSLTLSSLFVLSLYALVPRRVRSLPRDDAAHVKWRSGVVLGVAALATGIYPRLFCRGGGGGEELGEDGPELPPWYRYLGFSWQPTQDIKIALHVLALYLGPLCCAWLKIYHNARMLHWEGGKKSQRGSKHLRLLGPNDRLPLVPGLASLRRSLNFTWIQPTVQSFEHLRDDEDQRWKILRNLFIAPLAEEVVFRACLLPPLLASRASLSPTRASWIAPLFFGVAHIHHFVEKYRRLPARGRTRGAVSRLLAGAAVQWAYTTLFGAYVSHVFARTCSLGGVVVAHVTCNYMGLPDLGFAGPTSDLYGYRWPIAIVYLFGSCLFVAGFDSMLFPTESVLPSLLLRGV